MNLDELLDELMFLAKHPTEDMIAYQNEKKKVYYLQFSNGYRVYNGVDFVRLVFKEEVARRDFRSIMSEAEASNNRYQDLLDTAFQEKHGIETVEVIEIDQRIMLEEKLSYIRHNTNGGEDKEGQFMDTRLEVLKSIEKVLEMDKDVRLGLYLAYLQ